MGAANASAITWQDLKKCGRLMTGTLPLTARDGRRSRPTTRRSKGDATLFAREDYVEEAWRDSRISPPGGWQNPTVYLP
jgi:hypothetical protein